jgi:hypothetical protein
MNITLQVSGRTQEFNKTVLHLRALASKSISTKFLNPSYAIFEKSDGSFFMNISFI